MFETTVQTVGSMGNWS